MAKCRAKIRKNFLFSCLIISNLAWAENYSSSAHQFGRGSKNGIISDSPEWSAGLQIGNYGATGITAQHTGFMKGVLNLGIAIPERSATLHFDYSILFTEDFHYKPLYKTSGYNAFRGELNPFIGGGFDVGDNLTFALPFGLQYTMLHEPFNFFGSASLLFQNLLHSDDTKLGAWFALGVRILL